MSEKPVLIHLSATHRVIKDLGKMRWSNNIYISMEQSYKGVWGRGEGGSEGVSE